MSLYYVILCKHPQVANDCKSVWDSIVNTHQLINPPMMVQLGQCAMNSPCKQISIALERNPHQLKRSPAFSNGSNWVFQGAPTMQRWSKYLCTSFHAGGIQCKQTAVELYDEGSSSMGNQETSHWTQTWLWFLFKQLSYTPSSTTFKICCRDVMWFQDWLEVSCSWQKHASP